MLNEYVLIPDIFDSSSYTVPELCDFCLQNLKEPLLQEALVRDLSNGQWSTYINGQITTWHFRAKELIRKLINQNRLRKSSSIESNIPLNSIEWCKEAVRSDQMEPLSGIIAPFYVVKHFPNESKVAPIEKIQNTLWWKSRSPSVRLNRNTNDYLRHLRLVLGHANSLMFIDPHLNPNRPNYREFTKLLLAAKREKVDPLIEIHRVSYEGSGTKRKFPSNQDWLKNFHTGLADQLSQLGLSVEVFIWDDFHDRYLITDIIGISLPYGFDVTNNPKSKTTWTRLGREDRDDIQREFDPVSTQHTLKFRFSIGEL